MIMKDGIRHPYPSQIWKAATLEHVYHPPWFDFDWGRVKHVPTGNVYSCMAMADGKRKIICVGIGVIWVSKPGSREWNHERQSGEKMR